MADDATTQPAAELRTLRSRLDELAAAFATTYRPAEDFAGFLGMQYDLGLAWVHFPVGYGGLALPRSWQSVVEDRLHDLDGFDHRLINATAHGIYAPTLLAHGSDAQKEEFLRPLFTGELNWCQLFSEPAAGSDMAGVATRASYDGDTWVANGQKTWTTLAHVADRGLLLVRSDPELPKHDGMTMFIMDMHAEGVDVRPLRQMTGDAEFNEVFMSDVRIPDSDRLGQRGEGWQVALTTMMNERIALGFNVGPRDSGPISDALQAWKAHPGSEIQRHRLIDLWIRAEVIRLTSLRAQQLHAEGSPGPEQTIIRLLAGELTQEIYELCVDLLGPEGMLYDSYEMKQPSAFEADWLGDAQRRFLRSRADTIAGGTPEIMRNMLGERVLNLPREPRVDRGVPWRDIPSG